MPLAIDGLRSATGDIHARLHHHPAFAPLMAAPPDPAGCAILYSQLYGFHAAAEAALLPAAVALLPQLEDVAQRRKAHLLAADRDVLAVIYPNARPEAAWIAPATNVPELLGGLYVIEGATLGGRELGRALAPSLAALGLAEGEGCRFFMAYGTAQGAMWRRFCAVLELVAAGFPELGRRRMEQAAGDMFLTMETWLTATLPVRSLHATDA